MNIMGYYHAVNLLCDDELQEEVVMGGVVCLGIFHGIVKDAASSSRDPLCRDGKQMCRHSVSMQLFKAQRAHRQHIGDVGHLSSF